MNKNIFRLVFNKVRGFLIAVAECSASHSKASGQTVVGKGIIKPVALRQICMAIAMMSGSLVFITPLQAQIIADPGAPGNQRPTVINSSNGVPVVNIQTPSAAGVSRNTYSQFDVNAQGAIINNSRTDTQTQLGGWIQGSPWLAGGTARIILNEVNSSHPSNLNGFIEIGGDRAQFVLANPAGITCSGCGFINSDHVTLSTGTPVFMGGNLEGYRVQSGTVSIFGNGLNASQVSYTDIIARAVEVNAGIWANQLKITTGANSINASNTITTPIQGQGSAPVLAVDVAQLGGMYANKIIMIGTEAGVGVKNAGTIGSHTGEVIVTADGRLENAGRILSADSLQVNTKGMTNSGVLYAQTDTMIRSQGNISNDGIIASKESTLLRADGSISGSQNSFLGSSIQSDWTQGESLISLRFDLYY